MRILNYFFIQRIEVTPRAPMTFEDLYSNETTYDAVTTITVDFVRVKIFRAIVLLTTLVAILVITAP